MDFNKNKNMTELLDLLVTNQVQMIVILIAVDVVLGIIAALLKKEFVLGKLAGFMKKGILVYVFGFSVLLAVTRVVPSLALVATVSYWLIILALIGSILDNLGKIGIPIPKILRK